MSMFMSTIEGKIDAKGRVSVPAVFRAAIIAQTGVIPTGSVAQPHSIFVYPSFTENTIEGGGIHLSQSYNQMVDRLDPFSEEYEAMASVLFGDSHTLTFDADGRVSLPDALLQHAEIDKSLCFVGMGSKFRIWNPEAYAAHRAKARATALENRALLKSLSTPPPGGSKI
jgi:MraZ protein